ncbi:hypothetical protein ACETIH_23425 [Microvirga arabica]|uniref:Calcium-binding protein n=1 Tax=Microvirga arabica TaxID=1128671 RepID=A0ABV6YE76_9HYPH
MAYWNGDSRGPLALIFKGNDGFYGGDGNDNFYGFDGDDVFYGGNGSEYFAPGAGADTIDGGDGIDMLGYSEFAWIGPETDPGISIDLRLENFTDPSGGVDVFSSIEGVEGTRLSDTLTGSDADNELYGYDGNDVLNGLSGNDWLDGGKGADTLNGGLGTDIASYDSYAGTGTLYVDLDLSIGTDPWGFTDRFESIEVIRATGNNDTIIGSAADETFIGLGGADSIIGGAGIDMVSYHADFRRGGMFGVDVDLTLKRAFDGFRSLDSISGIENVNGTNFADAIRGDAARNELFGNGGNDDLQGGGGDDLLDGGSGNDVLHNEGGIDTFQGGAGSDIFVIGQNEAVSGEVFDGGDDWDTLQLVGDNNFTYSFVYNIERLEFAVSTRVALTGIQTASPWQVVGNTGADAIRITGSTNLSGWTFANWNGGVDSITVTGLADADQIVGSGMGDTLQGAEGSDDLQGGGGNDLLDGGSGDDVLHNEAGVDTFQGGAGNDVIHVGQNEALSGEVFDGGEDTDTLIIFGANNFTHSFVYNIERLEFAVSTTVALTGIQTASPWQVVGNTGADAIRITGSTNLSGWTFANWNGGVDSITVTGLSGADKIIGSGVSDTLQGADGNDTLDGAGGADQLAGGLGDDTYYVDNASDRVSENTAQGTDTVYTSVSYALSSSAEVEVLRTTSPSGTSPINLTGSNTANTLHGNAGANRLDGRGGADKLYGYGGNDSYYVDVASDLVMEGSGGGTDTVYTSVSYALNSTAEVEVLRTIDAAAATSLNLTGSNTANTLYGNAGANVLNGKGGNDVLTGAAGADAFVFDTALSATTNVDRITDFSVVDDTIRLENAIFTKLTTTGTLTTAAFWTGTGAHDADDRIIYNKSTGALMYDADGIGAGAAIKFAQLAAGLALTNADFVVI